ncbi:MAG: hypothetical protein ACLRNA_03485 [Gemmiger formicilis]|uniref:hypothetical protein n=1 Tax=Gemmiger formicilis TaxID=745368 RepID=UPI003A1A9A07
MALTARAGQKVKLTCGEALDENGNFTQENFQDRNRHRRAAPPDTGACLQRGENHFKPHFTIMASAMPRSKPTPTCRCRVYRPRRLLRYGGDGQIYLRR